ncbi:ParB N-terminal domain-containing protein [Candidatus Micrarchaeota archaeon]|nr:ParB N-terminal domain-containing protein [Candidatus Micrarchaeota archaeon]
MPLIPAGQLRPHERIERMRLRKVRADIEARGVLDYPLLVYEETRVILDGHHRFRALQLMGCPLIPVQFIRYEGKAVQVSSQRPGVRVSKARVRERGLTGRLFPPKTTKHAYKKRRKPFKLNESSVLALEGGPTIY